VHPTIGVVLYQVLQVREQLC